MRKFHKLENWNKDRDGDRRLLASEVLTKHGIKFTCPSKGHFKIESSCHTLMFYPKSGVIIWKGHRDDRQHRYANDDEGMVINKIKTLL